MCPQGDWPCRMYVLQVTIGDERPRLVDRLSLHAQILREPKDMILDSRMGRYLESRHKAAPTLSDAKTTGW